MACNIEYDPKAVKQLKKLEKAMALQIIEGIEKYALDEKAKKIVKLKTPFDGGFRLRVGDYRVIFYKEDDLILISKIAHRKEVYL